jgi:hypothetical protein
MQEYTIKIFLEYSKKYKDLKNRINKKGEK